MRFHPQTDGIAVVNRLDHLATPLGHQAADAVLAGDSVEEGALMLEAATLEDIVSSQVGHLVEGDAMILEAITTTRARVQRTMSAFKRALDQQLRGTELSTQEVELAKPRKSMGYTIMTARIGISDGQAVSIVFNSPGNDSGKLTTDDTLVAFRFLMNKRDVTHAVAKHKGQDISLKSVTMVLSNLLERNSAKFQERQADNAERRQELENTEAEVAKAESNRAELQGQLEQLTDETDELQLKLSKAKGLEEKQTVTNEQLQSDIDGLKERLANAKKAQEEAPAVNDWAQEGAVFDLDGSRYIVSKRDGNDVHYKGYPDALAGSGFSALHLLLKEATLVAMDDAEQAAQEQAEQAAEGSDFVEAYGQRYDRAEDGSAILKVDSRVETGTGLMVVDGIDWESGKVFMRGVPPEGYLIHTMSLDELEAAANLKYWRRPEVVDDGSPEALRQLVYNLQSDIDGYSSLSPKPKANLQKRLKEALARLAKAEGADDIPVTEEMIKAYRQGDDLLKTLMQEHEYHVAKNVYDRAEKAAYEQAQEEYNARPDVIIKRKLHQELARQLPADQYERESNEDLGTITAGNGKVWIAGLEVNQDERTWTLTMRYDPYDRGRRVRVGQTETKTYKLTDGMLLESVEPGIAEAAGDVLEFVADHRGDMPEFLDHRPGYGSNYERTGGMDMNDLRKLIKKELTSGAPGTKWKVNKGAGGYKEINVKLADLPAGWQVFTEEYVRNKDADWDVLQDIQRYTDKTEALIAWAEAQIQSHNHTFSESDMMTDYAGVYRLGGSRVSVELDRDLKEQRLAAQAAAIAAADEGSDEEGLTAEQQEQIDAWQASIDDYRQTREDLEQKKITPSKVVGRGYQNSSVARKVAFDWLDTQIENAEAKIRALEATVAAGGALGEDDLRRLKHERLVALMERKRPRGWKFAFDRNDPSEELIAIEPPAKQVPAELLDDDGYPDDDEVSFVVGIAGSDPMGPLGVFYGEGSPLPDGMGSHVNGWSGITMAITAVMDRQAEKLRANGQDDAPGDDDGAALGDGDAPVVNAGEDDPAGTEPETDPAPEAEPEPETEPEPDPELTPAEDEPDVSDNGTVEAAVSALEKLEQLKPGEMDTDDLELELDRLIEVFDQAGVIDEYNDRLMVVSELLDAITFQEQENLGL